MRTRRCAKRGQVLVMVTFALFAMIGLLGLAVDLGWSYFTKKSAQSAADSAALAAVMAAYVMEDPNDDNTTYQCVTEVTCQPIAPCTHPVPNPPTNNIENGCLYAAQNGFAVTPNGRQNVTMEANITNPPPTAPGVFSYYWVTSRVTEGIPQLFSSILGNTMGLTSARATAAIIDSSILGSLILINRENDCVPMDTGGRTVCGVDLLVQANNNQGNDAVRADGGVLMASVKRGLTADGRYAGENQGGGTVRAPFTFIRGDGWITLGGGSTWIEEPDNGFADRGYFRDPMRGKGQPPPPSLEPTDTNVRPILGGTLLGSDDPNNPAIFPQGYYYAARLVNNQPVATGDPMTLSGHVKFVADGDGFGDFVFFGGLRNQRAGTTVTFDPGRYVFAGVKPTGQNPNPLFDVQVNMTLKDATPTVGRNSDPGEIFIFTDAYYPGLKVPSAITPDIRSQLRHGKAGFFTGNNADIYVNIHGLNRDHSSLPQELEDFSPVILWQDQRNSVIKYTPNGYIDNSCDNPDPQGGCPNTDLRDPRSTEMFFKASPSLHIYGVAYQPRGAFTSMVGGGGYDSPLQLIAGALMVHGNSNVRLQRLDNPLFIKVAALVE